MLHRSLKRERGRGKDEDRFPVRFGAFVPYIFYGYFELP